RNRTNSRRFLDGERRSAAPPIALARNVRRPTTIWTPWFFSGNVRMSLPVAAAKAFSTAGAATQKASELAAAIVWRPGARVTHRSVTARCYSPRLLVEGGFGDHRRPDGPAGGG